MRTLHGVEYDFEGCARDSRIGFAQALAEKKLPGTLRNVQLDFLTDPAEHLHAEEGGGPDLVSPATYDLFSSSLRSFALYLRRLDLRLMADSALFWPVEDGAVACFPNLELLSIMFHPMAPSGSWYFHGTEGEGQYNIGYQVTPSMYPPLTSSDLRNVNWHFEELAPSGIGSRYFRNVPNEEMMRPFLEAFARAAGNMHVLRAFSLWSPLGGGNAWGIAYARPGEQPTIGTLYSPSANCNFLRQLWWKVHPWRPSAFLHEQFQDIGRAGYCEELLEHWNDERCGWANWEAFTESSAAFPNSGEYPEWSGARRPPHELAYSWAKYERRR
jgi:hypothetical protein